MKRTATALAAIFAPAPALAAFSAQAAPMPPSTQFLVSVALMAVGGAFVLWEGWMLSRERKRRRAARRGASPTASSAQPSGRVNRRTRARGTGPPTSSSRIGAP